MVTRRRHGPWVLGRRGILAEDQAGSAVVAALALSLVLTLLAGTVMARSVGAVAGAAAAHDRLLARTIAEDVLHGAIVAIDAQVLGSSAASTGGSGIPLDVIDALADDPHGAADVAVDVREEGGEILIRVDATVGTALSTATARLRPTSTSDLAWFTESRALDPTLLGLPRVACTWPMGDARRHPECRDMPVDVGSIDGALHSNDPLPESGTGAVVTSVTSSALDANGVAHRSEMRLPRDAASVLAGRPPTCRFRGPTLLRFDGPRLRVTSPRSVPRPEDVDGAHDAIGCLDIDRAALGGVVVVELPATAVIEVVADVRNDCALHPLGIDPVEDLERAWPCDAGDAFVWGRYTGARTVVAHDSIQVVWDLEPGDAGARRDLSHGDVLGLVAGDSVVLRRPIVPDPMTLDLVAAAFAGPGIPPFGAFPLDAPSLQPIRWDEPHIVGAIASLRGSLAPQNLRYGEEVTVPVTVVGSVAGRFSPAVRWDVLNRRGRIVATLAFPLVLTYDERLVDDPPPMMPSIDEGRLRIVELDVG